jgi:hypothetical protein
VVGVEIRAIACRLCPVVRTPPSAERSDALTLIFGVAELIIRNSWPATTPVVGSLQVCWPAVVPVNCWITLEVEVSVVVPADTAVDVKLGAAPAESVLSDFSHVLPL